MSSSWSFWSVFSQCWYCNISIIDHHYFRNILRKMAKNCKKKIERNRKKFRNYTNEKLMVAIRDIRQGLSIRAASKKHKIPYSSWNLYSKTLTNDMKKMGLAPFLTLAREKVFVDWILAMQKKQFPVTMLELVNNVRKFVIKNKLQTKFKNNRPG